MNKCEYCSKQSTRFYNNKSLCELHYVLENPERNMSLYNHLIFKKMKINPNKILFCSVIDCKEKPVNRDDISYYGLHLKLGFCKKHADQAVKTALYEVENMDKPNKCPILCFDGLEEREDGKYKKYIDVENSKCFHPAVFVRIGCPDNFMTPCMFRCPVCYTDGGDYTNCDLFSKWWWHKFGNGQKIGKRSNGRNPISNSLRHEVFKKDDYTCIECGATKDERTLHVDHITPVSQGGTDELDNLQTLCEKCNIAKNNRKW